MVLSKEHSDIVDVNMNRDYFNGCANDPAGVGRKHGNQLGLSII